MRIPDSEVSFTFSRSGGAGGQNVNKVSTRVTLRWSPAASTALSASERARLLANSEFARRLTRDGDLVLHEDGSRSQDFNREVVLERLTEIVTRALVIPKRRRATKPTKSSRERRLETKKVRANRKAGRRRVSDD